jgi:hypothetical protein
MEIIKNSDIFLLAFLLYKLIPPSNQIFFGFFASDKKWIPGSIISIFTIYKIYVQYFIQNSLEKYMKTEILFLSLFSVFSVMLLKNNDPSRYLGGIPSTIFLSSFSSVLSFILGNILVRGKLSNLVSLKLPSKFLIKVVSKTPPYLVSFFFCWSPTFFTGRYRN